MTKEPVAPAVTSTEVPAQAGVSILFAIAAASCLAIALTLRTAGFQPWLLAMVHLATLAALAILVLSDVRHHRDPSLSLLAFLTSVAVGPLGPAGTALLSLAQRGRSQPPPLLAEWYERISMSTAVDPVARLSDDVSVGRSINLNGVKPASFPVVIEAGTLAERQAVLGLIARRFHPDYLPVLQSALKSPEPVIRVQAAAVAAHVRQAISRLYQRCVADLGEASADPADALALMQRLEALIDSGLLDEGDRQRGLEIANRLGDVVISGLRSGTRASQAMTRGPAALDDTLERLLLRRRQFSVLRSHRSEKRILQRHAVARVRRLGSPVGLVPAAMERAV